MHVALVLIKELDFAMVRYVCVQLTEINISIVYTACIYHQDNHTASLGMQLHEGFIPLKSTK